MKFNSCCLLLTAALVAASWSPNSAAQYGLTPKAFGRVAHNNIDEVQSLEPLLSLRGGARRKKSKVASLSSSSKTVTGKKKVGAKQKEEKKSPTGDLVQKYKQILPLTRFYITLVGLCTLLGLVLGDENSQALLALDPMRTLYGWEMWRPLTAASFLGKPSVGWLMSGYYLFEYGSSLERAYGPAQYLVFLMTQVGLLSFLSIICGQPFFANSVITSMLHVLSRAMPKQKVKWLIFTVPYWSLPYGLMAMDVLQAQNASAALPHILGILSGHFYHFHRFIWPKTGGEDWLTAPDFLIEKMDPNAASKSATKASLDKALKSRKRGKGKKLGK